MGIFGMKGEKKVPKTPPQLTFQELKSIYDQVKLNNLAGKGHFSLEELQIDAVLAQWNLYAIAAREMVEDEGDILELKKTA